MIRVAHFINSLGVGGAEVSLARLVETTSGEIQHRVYSLLDVTDLAERIESAGAPVEVLGTAQRASANSAWSGPKLWRVSRQLDVDLVQGWLYLGNLAASLAGSFAGGTPVVWSVRMGIPPQRGLKSRLWTLALLAGAVRSRRPAAIVYNSDLVRRSRVRLGFSDARARTIPNGVDTQRFSPDRKAGRRQRAALGFSEQDIVIGRIARVHPWKDHELFLQAMARVADRIPRLRILIVGRSVTEGSGVVATWIHRLGLEDRAVLLDEQRDPLPYYRMLDVLASSSLAEGSPNNVLEAMACGVPCVVTDSGDSAAVVGDCGIVVPTGEVLSFAEATEHLAGLAPETRLALGNAARQRICSHFDVHRFGERWLALYRQLCPLARARRPATGP